MALLVGVHFIIAATPGATKSVAQAAVFSWPGLAITAAIGAIGLACLSFTRLPGLWDKDQPFRAKVVLPLAIGLVLGASQAATDAMTGWGAVMAQQLKMASIHIAWPLSAAIYPGGAILVSILYFLTLIPLAVLLISQLLLKGKALDLVYWAVALPCALVEPWTQGDFKAAAGGGSAPVLFAIEDTALNLAQVWMLRRHGFVACVIVRIGFYAVWHIGWPMVGG